jgi:hypothetical protein
MYFILNSQETQEENVMEIETLDNEQETFGGAIAKAFLWAIVFGELIVILGTWPRS